VPDDTDVTDLPAARSVTTTGLFAPKLFKPKGPRPTKEDGDAPAPTKRRRKKGGGAGPLLLGTLLFVVSILHAWVGRKDEPDQHLLKARRMLERYENGRPEAQRDYESEAYVKVLDQLARVPQRSPQAIEAEDLAESIRRKIDAQRAAVRARERELATRQSATQRRDQAFFDGVRQEPLAAEDPDDVPRKPGPIQEGEASESR